MIGGYRPLAHLRPLCLPSNFADIADRLSGHPATGWRSKGLAHLGASGLRRATLAPNNAASPQNAMVPRNAVAPQNAVVTGKPVVPQSAAVPRSTVAPPRTGRVHQTGPLDRIVIRRVQICETIDGVAEIAVVLARRDQVWAMALRIERSGGRWLCTHLEVV